MISFNKRLIDRANGIGSYLCVGIDISPELLGSDDLEDMISHSKLVVDATKDLALAYKPNFAFFERWGPKGFSWLEDLVEYPVVTSYGGSVIIESFVAGFSTTELLKKGNT